MNKTLNVMIGFDQNESIAMHTLIHSIISQSSIPVSITPIHLKNLENIYIRERDPKQSNDFSFSRFLTPYLSNFKGWSLYLDCDMMLRTDISKLFELADPSKAVMVVKHNYTPSTNIKFLNAKQYIYPRKNWSSVILFNNELCQALTPEYINTEPAMDLHQFKWLDDSVIGELPKEWNHLVGENPPNPHAHNVHWTLGGPYFNEYSNAEFSMEWRDVYENTIHCSQIEK